MTAVPVTPDAQRWYSAGYQAALADIVREIFDGGEAAVLEWLAVNAKKEVS